MVVAFDTSFLSSYYQARANLKAGTGSTNLASGSGRTPTAPTPPWKAAVKAEPSDLVRSVLAGGKFINAGAAKLDVADASDDYRKLFGLYQGVLSLQGLADRIGANSMSETEKTRYRTAFAAGMKEFGSYLDSNTFKEFQLTTGGVAPKAVSTSGVKRETDTYTTKTLFSGTASAAVDAFAGAVQFSMAAKLPSGTVKTVNFDLAEMGATTRSMSNVVLYLNGKLAAAGIDTRFANVRTPGTPKTTTAGGQTIAMGTNPDTFALKLVGSSAEQVTFTAPASEPAVYLAGQVGGATATGATTSTPTSRQLTKYTTDTTPDSTLAADGKVFTNTMASSIQALRQTVAAPDGSVYVLADVNALTDGQAIKGQTDVALMKYDSSGNLLYTRTLGAALSASGYALAVSADGARVAVAGSVTGALDSGDVGKDATLSDSFLAVFDAKGDAVFSDRRAATAADQVNAVTFGADGAVYVQGGTSSAMAGATAVGGQDAYVRGYKPTVAGAAEAYGVGFTVQYGTSSTDKPAGVAVNGSTMVVASVENGQAVLRRYDLQASGAPVLGATRVLGNMQGSLAGVAFAADGSVIVAGTTSNSALSAGTVTTAFSGTQAAFVAKLSGTLTAGASDRLTYYGGGTRSASGVTIAGGQVYVTGQLAVTPLPGQSKAFDGYAAAIDPTTGAIGWSKQFQGLDRMAAPSSIAVDTSGASILDRLGLPKGTIDYSGSQLLTAATSVRPGDQFTVRSGTGTAKAVTIEANDTLKTLAAKISRAVGFTAKVEVVIKDGYDRLQITPLNVRTPIEIDAGKVGRDALRALGLNEGLIAQQANDAKGEKPSYGLQLTSGLSLDNDGKVKQTQAQLLSALSTLRSIYADMTKPPETAASKAGGEVPAYLSGRIASYQAALSRLTGT